VTESGNGRANEPTENGALANLRREIAHLHIHNGEPSTRAIATGTGRIISHTTVHTVLRCSKLPSWGHLELVVRQLKGDVESFRTLWITARNSLHGINASSTSALLEENHSTKDPTQSSNAAPQDVTEPSLLSDSRPIQQLVEEFISRLENVGATSAQRIMTGLEELDLISGGLRPGQLTLIAGYPAMGKSTLALDFCRSAAIRQSLSTLLMSFRMTKDEATRRIISAEARIPLHRLRSGDLTDEEWAKLAERIGPVHEGKLVVNDTHTPTMQVIIDEARYMTKSRDLKFLIIDSIQQLIVEEYPDSRRLETARLSRTLKLLAVELQIPIVGVTTVSPLIWSQKTTEPEAPDLENLDGADEDADVVIVLHRDDYYDEMSPRAGEADLIVRKNRDGPMAVTTVAAQLHLCRFVDIRIFEPVTDSPNTSDSP
jgi:replicative DNA helicase